MGLWACENHREFNAEENGRSNVDIISKHHTYWSESNGHRCLIQWKCKRIIMQYYKPLSHYRTNYLILIIFLCNMLYK